MNEQTNDRARVIDKIRKLIGLSTSPNENEAASAAEKVQAMLAEYNLTMADVTVTKTAEEKIVIDSGLYTDSLPWRRPIAVGVANLYFCRYYFTHNKVESTTRSCGYVRFDIHNFVGTEANVVVAKLMFQYLIDTVDRLAKAGALTVPTGQRSAYITSFRGAAAMRLSHRLHTRLQASRVGGQIKTEKGTTLPALASLYDQMKARVDKVIEDEVGGLRSKKNKFTANHPGGVRDGLAAGESIGLDDQVTGRKDKGLTDKRPKDGTVPGH